MLPKRDLGTTGMRVSCLGLGTVKFGRNQGVKYPEGFELPSDREITALLDLAPGSRDKPARHRSRLWQQRTANRQALAGP